MKFYFNAIVLPLFSLLILFTSCSENDLQPDPTKGLIKISETYALGAAARVEIWSKEELFAGYNQLYLAVYDSITGDRITDSHIHVQALMQMETMSHGCPVENPEEQAVNKLFPVNIMFTMPSSDTDSWTITISVHNHNYGKFGHGTIPVSVKAKTPSQVLAFKDDASGKRYYISYNFNKPITVGPNDFEFIIFTMKDGEYVPVENLSIETSPNMPAMDHGSPNNLNPTHQGNGHYRGVVNFTMTGDWRINLKITDGTSTINDRYFDLNVN